MQNDMATTLMKEMGADLPSSGESGGGGDGQEMSGMADSSNEEIVGEYCFRNIPKGDSAGGLSFLHYCIEEVKAVNDPDGKGEGRCARTPEGKREYVFMLYEVIYRILSESPEVYLNQLSKEELNAINLITNRKYGYLNIKFRIDPNGSWIEVGYFNQNYTDGETYEAFTEAVKDELKNKTHYEANARKRFQDLKKQNEEEEKEKKNDDMLKDFQKQMPTSPPSQPDFIPISSTSNQQSGTTTVPPVSTVPSVPSSEPRRDEALKNYYLSQMIGFDHQMSDETLSRLLLDVTPRLKSLNTNTVKEICSCSEPLATLSLMLSK